MSPLCETYPGPNDLNRGESYYPLHAYICENCFLVQLEQYESPQNIFSEYPYFSSYSDSWLKHCENYCNQVIARFNLGRHSSVVEVGSNDGYLLQYFVKRNVPVLGIEPAANVTEVAFEKGIPALADFFSTKLAERLARDRGRADLVIANNVLSEVPDLNDFVEGLKILLKPTGVLTLEFPHLLRLMELREFDTIHHEHLSYFSMITAKRILEAHGLKVFDIEELKSHGGSLRVYACRAENPTYGAGVSVERLVAEEEHAGLASMKGYENYGRQIKQAKIALLDFLLTTAHEEKKVAGYGAPGKSATLLHYCGITKDFIEYTVDRNPHKQGRFLPGSHIPIYHPDRIRETKPDYIVILPWNLREEITQQLQYIREWGGRFVVPLPSMGVY